MKKREVVITICDVPEEYSFELKLREGITYCGGTYLHSLDDLVKFIQDGSLSDFLSGGI